MKITAHRFWLSSAMVLTSIVGSPLQTSFAEEITLIDVPESITVPCDAIPTAPTVTATGGCDFTAQDENLILHYPFDRVYDASPSGHHGDLFPPREPLRTAFHCDGQTAIDVGPFSDALTSTGISFGGWIRPDRRASGLSVIGNTLEFNESFLLAVATDNGNVAANIRRADGFVVLNNPGYVVTGIWQHVMATYDGHQLKVFYNGQLLSSSPYQAIEMPIMSNGVNTTVGDSGLGRGWYFSGDLDDIRVYDRALTTEEVTALAATAPPPPKVVLEEVPATGCPGTLTRIWTATDLCGAEVSATQTITLVGAPAIELIGLPDDITVACGDLPEPAAVTATSSCDAVVSDDQLILHYTFESTNSLGQDLSLRGNDGQPVNVQSTAGVAGWGLHAPGNGYIEVGAFTDLYAGEGLTFGGWIRPDRTQAGMGVIGNTLAANESFLLAVATDNGNVAANLRRDDGFLVLNNPGYAITGEWQHVMATYDGHQLTVYFNGQLLSSTPYLTNALPVASNGVATTVADSGLGRGWNFSGDLDDIRVYGRALASNEVAILAAEQPGSPDVSLIEIPAEGCPGTHTRIWTVTDLCGNTISATQTITLTAAEVAPDLVGVPSDLTLYAGEDIPPSPVVTALDECDVIGAPGRWNDGTDNLNPDAVNWHYVIEWEGDIGGAEGSVTNPANGHAYAIVDSSIRWTEAAAAAQLVYNDLTGHLATITSQAENDFILSLMPPQLGAAKIGGTDVDEEGVWKWITGEPFSFANWTHGEPNNQSGQEDYLEIYGPLWNGARTGAAAVQQEEAILPGPPMQIIRTWTATGACGGVTSATQVITLVDEPPPPQAPELHGVPVDLTLWPEDPMPPPPVVTATDPCDTTGAPGRWNDGTDNFNFDQINWYFVIEWDGDVDGAIGPTVNPENGHAYQIVNGSVRWTEAAQLAQIVYNDVTGHLATITSQAENDFIYNLMPTNLGAAKIGGLDVDEEGVWTWITGEPFSFANWTHGEPNNSGGEDYMEMYGPFWAGVRTGAAPVYFEESTLPGPTSQWVRTWTSTGACGGVTSATQVITLLDEVIQPLVTTSMDSPEATELVWDTDPTCWQYVEAMDLTFDSTHQWTVIQTFAPPVPTICRFVDKSSSDTGNARVYRIRQVRAR
ncbi:MAG: hypothetical protein KDL31_08335 [Kiritimatiellae bacterium]|nr:hypothetical protein [Kiritimatiellia bacterium]